MRKKEESKKNLGFELDIGRVSSALESMQIAGVVEEGSKKNLGFEVDVDGALESMQIAGVVEEGSKKNLRGRGGWWSDIEDNLLSTIFVKLDAVDFIRVAAVSRWWRRSASSTNRRQLPWLMLSGGGDEGDIRWMMSLSEGRTYKMRLPEIAGMHCGGSAAGWLIMKDSKTGDPFGFNPMTGSTFCLPGIAKLPWIWQVLEDDGVIRYCFHGQSTASTAELSHFIHLNRFILHLDSSSMTPSLVVAFSMSGNKAVFCRPSAGDESWKDLGPRPANFFNNAIIHKGSFYVVDRIGGLTIYNDLIRTGDCTSQILHGTNIPTATRLISGGYMYLVESSSSHHLLLVHRKMMCRVTKMMTVYKLIGDGDGWQWSRVESLVDEAIFIGMSQAMCFSTRDQPYFTPNSIYFTDDNDLNAFTYRENHTPDLADLVVSGVYHLEDGTISPLNLGEQQHPWPFPIWFTPLLNVS